jgi:hypothetical protein
VTKKETHKTKEKDIIESEKLVPYIYFLLQVRNKSMEDGEDVYVTDLSQLFSEEDEVNFFTQKYIYFFSISNYVNLLIFPNAYHFFYYFFLTLFMGYLSDV